MAAGDVLRLFLELNVWLCAASVVMAVISALALSIPLSTVGVGFFLPALLFYFIYVEDRRDIDAEDWTNHPRRTRLVERYRNGLLVTEVVALLGYEGLLLFFVRSHESAGVELFVLGNLPLVVLASYGLIKRRPAFDSIAVGGTWAFVIVFAVLVSTGQPFSRDAAVVFVAWFLITFAGVESRNVRDIEGDTEADRTTLASLLGVRTTRALEGTLKTAGVGIFWYLSGVMVAVLVILHLLVLHFFRFLTEGADTRIAG